MEFMESLPPDCPPTKAEVIADPRILYRIASNRPPVAEDFHSQRYEKPHSRFTVPECYACGVSVYSKPDVPTKNLKLPKFKGMHVARVTLVPDSGYIEKTFGEHHYTFWPFSDFLPAEAPEGDSS